MIKTVHYYLIKTVHLYLVIYSIKIRLRDQLHEHFVIIDGEIVWYGSMNFLSWAKDDDNLIRLKSKDAAQELMEMTFG